MTTDAPPTRARALGELARLFLRLGATAFGGPAAHIAMMEHEVVVVRGWLGRAEFLDLLAATNLIPGPNSTEMAIHVGHRRAGWPGLLVAGACFIGPAAAVTLALAWAYVRFARLPAATGILYGVKPVVIAIVAQALWRLGRAALKSWLGVAVAAVAAVASFAGANELAVLLAAGVATALVRRVRARPPVLALAAAPLPVAASLPVSFGLAPLFLFFLKVGAVLFGSGYVLLAFLRADLVDHWHWLTEAQLLDAVAVGQVTPGPVFTTATFIGYLLGRGAGAAVATAGIFAPAFVFVAASGPLVPRLRRSPVAGAFLDGVIAASLALMAVVTWALARAAVVDVATAVVALGAVAALARWPRLNSAWLLAVGAAVGLVASLVRP